MPLRSAGPIANILTNCGTYHCTECNTEYCTVIQDIISNRSVCHEFFGNGRDLPCVAHLHGNRNSYSDSGNGGDLLVLQTLLLEANYRGGGGLASPPDTAEAIPKTIVEAMVVNNSIPSKTAMTPSAPPEESKCDA
uniref:Uncharacterized protein n=1 Tax=Pinguiococcus pyrenoidosus TaxID=172671 RepID=A0A6U0UTY6_9STRA